MPLATRAAPRHPARHAPPFPPRTAAHSQKAESTGRRGERLAGWWLRLKGWQVLDRRVRTPAGEVDLVARRGSLVAFIEVKTRATAADLDWAIDERRLARVAGGGGAADAALCGGRGDDIRVDDAAARPRLRPRHIENAGSAAETRLHPAATAPSPIGVHVPFRRGPDGPARRINIAGDSSFALMLSAQARGHRLFHYGPEDLNWSDGRLTARALGDGAAGWAGADHFRFDAPSASTWGRGRRHPDAPGPALRPGLYHRDAPAGADRRPDPGRQTIRTASAMRPKRCSCWTMRISCRRRSSPAR